MKEFLKKLGRSATGRKGIGNTVTVAIIIAVVMLNILAYALMNAFGLYVYSPENYDLSISGSTDELFEKSIALGKKVTITFCYGDDDTLAKHDTGSLVLTTAREFEERYPELVEVEYINILTCRNSKGELVNLSKYQKDMRTKKQKEENVPVRISNKYEINGVPKTQKDFIKALEEYGIDVENFALLTHPNVFVSMKSADCRKILFGTVPDITDKDVADTLPECVEARELLKDL